MPAPAPTRRIIKLQNNAARPSGTAQIHNTSSQLLVVTASNCTFFFSSSGTRSASFWTRTAYQGTGAPPGSLGTLAFGGG